MALVYMGYDSREKEAWDVAAHSIISRSRGDVEVRAVGLTNLPGRPVERRDGKLWCQISEAPMATEFAIARFMAPLLACEGWALFVDCDTICLADIGELFALADPKYAVMCVKHGSFVDANVYLSNTVDVKMDGQVQTTYPRKNWSSVVLWNCSHPSNRRLTQHMIETWPGRMLHAFTWLEDCEIGALPPAWNYLVGINSDLNAAGAKLLHYTLGGPWINEWRGGPLDHTWKAERDAYRKAVG